MIGKLNRFNRVTSQRFILWKNIKLETQITQYRDLKKDTTLGKPGTPSQFPKVKVKLSATGVA